MPMRLDVFADIPHEIIFEIFLQCLPNDASSRGPQDAPILLTHVCSSWRKLASQVPELWRNILLRCNTEDQPALTISQAIALKTKAVDQIALWKYNSRGQLMDISLELRCLQNGTVDFIDERFWDAILERAILDKPEHVQNLSLKFDYCDIGTPIYALPRTSFFNLETLEFTQLLMTSSPTITCFSKASKLRRVVTDAGLPPRISTPCTVIDLPWAQLTHLVLLAPQLSQTFHFVSTECPKLQILCMKLQQDVPASFLPPGTETTALAHLRELSLTLTNIENLSFMSSIDFPRMTKLQFWTDARYGYRSIKWDQPFLAHHNHFIDQLHLLHSLTLGHQNIGCDALLGILRETPLLVEFIVESELGTLPRFLDALTYNPEDDFNSLLLPKLEIFRLYIDIRRCTSTDMSEGPFTNASFFDMITSRSKLLNLSEGDAYHGLNHVAYLQDVLFHVFKPVFSSPQFLDHDDLASRARHFSEMDSGVSLHVRFSSRKQNSNWLREEIPTW
ncbi:hypothetical protein GALMADRAFT_242156 [Galerina marginata CBS 339.88]|uniref:Uncharacterized protein n=1 Tax=Galerina marginata (strain CBS 339.88) TaxID=685588 RepID=A0A067TM18_GALM3|nr:hypothetical protein GALMADRAFT_242156 [Galerina marginata CBS 339.88]